MSALEDFLRAAGKGESVWLGDVRESLAAETGHVEAVIRLTLPKGEERDYVFPLVRPETEKERSLLCRALRAQLFNLLSACSASSLQLYLPEQADAALWTLAEEALEGLTEPGYGKALRVADRLCAGVGAPPYHSGLLPLSAREPLPTPTYRAAPPLAPRLRKRAAMGERGLRCGLDVGGTDIKLAIARDGELLLTEEFDWDPSRFQRAEELMEPIQAFLFRGLEKACPGETARPDSLGLSFPDVVIRDRILGGETPKTRGMRDADPAAYESEFRKLAGLKEKLEAVCRPGTRVRVLNDGSMAAFSAALELACAGEDEAISRGVFAHSLGTDLGSGWLDEDGTVPELPLELYDLLIDLGSDPKAALSVEDLRSTRNENSGLPGARRYLGQAAAYRLAWERNPRLLEDFAEEKDGVLRIRQEPEDLRKPCLEHLMRQAEMGEPAAREAFRQIGRHLGQISREIEFILAPQTPRRFLFGRFVRHPGCFRLLREGCAEVMPQLELCPADEGLAYSPLMRALASRKDGAVARFGQAVGAIYYGIKEE